MYSEYTTNVLKSYPFNEMPKHSGAAFQNVPE